MDDIIQERRERPRPPWWFVPAIWAGLTGATALIAISISGAE